MGDKSQQGFCFKPPSFCLKQEGKFSTSITQLWPLSLWESLPRSLSNLQSPNILWIAALTYKSAAGHCFSSAFIFSHLISCHICSQHLSELGIPPNPKPAPRDLRPVSVLLQHSSLSLPFISGCVQDILLPTIALFRIDKQNPPVGQMLTFCL